MLGSGRIFHLQGEQGVAVLLYRDRDAAFYASSKAYLVPANLAQRNPRDLLDAVDRGDIRLHGLGGFDTFWYTWVAVNENTELLE